MPVHIIPSDDLDLVSAETPAMRLIELMVELAELEALQGTMLKRTLATTVILDCARAKRAAAVREFLAEHHSMLRLIRGEVPQRKLAKLADVPQAYVSYVENGQSTNVPVDDVCRLLRAYSTLLEVKDGGSGHGAAGSSGSEAREARGASDVA